MANTPPLRGAFRVDTRARQSYAEGAGIYRIVPGAVALPADEADVATLVRWAEREGCPLVPRGAGSAMGGGNVGEGTIVDLGSIVPAAQLDPGARTVDVGASTTLGEIAALAGAHHLRLPPDPSSSRWATSGGVFSTNAAGPRSLHYGPARPWVLSARVVTAGGEVLELSRGRPGTGEALRRFESGTAPLLRSAAQLIRDRFPRTAKNSSGYALDAWLDSGDVLDLFIGAEGTLGIVTGITWQLDAMPACRSTLRVALARLDQLGDAVHALVASGPSSCELLDRTFLELVRGPDAEGLLLLEYEAEDEARLREKVALGEAAARGRGLPSDSARDAATEAEFWSLRHAASPILAKLPPERRSLQVVEDGCVPVDRLADYVRLLRNAAVARGIPIVLFGHAGSGHLHANLLPDVTRPGWDRIAEELLTEVSAGVVTLGGTLSGEHGDGRLRAGLLESVYGSEVLRLFEQVKACFDPLGIFNPGVILPARMHTRALSRLKVGAGAVPLDDDIAAGLRQIERDAGYATPRLALADTPESDPTR